MGEPAIKKAASIAEIDAALEEIEAALPAEPHGAVSHPLSLAKTWRRASVMLRAELGEDIWQSWFARMQFEAMENGIAHVSVPTRFLKSWIAAHYAERVLVCLKRVRPDVTRMEIAVRSVVIRTEAPARPPGPSEKPAGLVNGVPSAVVGVDASEGAPRSRPAPLPEYGFDAFVRCPANELALATARIVAFAPAAYQQFSVIYLHARIGYGKSHLLRAIAQESDRPAIYLPSDRLIGIAGGGEHLDELVRNAAVVLLDDVHFVKTPRALAAVRALIESGVQVVLAAPMWPVDLEWSNDDLRSRVAGGLVLEIGEPDLDARIEIMRRRAARLPETFRPDDEVLGAVAHAVKNPRDLIGIVNRLWVIFTVGKKAPTIAVAMNAIREIVAPVAPARIQIEAIQRVVARHWNVSRIDIISHRRTANVTRPRQIAMFIAKRLTTRSLPEIGRRFGDRDHSTVHHAVHKIEGLAAADPALKAEIEALIAELREQ